MISKVEILKLSPRATHLIERLKNADKIRILFVCLGNICRSPAAEGIMRSLIENRNVENGLMPLRWEVDSAGTGNYHIGDLPDRRMIIHARQRGYELTHRCRQIREADFSEFDIIIGMDANNLRNLHTVAPTPEDEEKILGMAEFIDPALRYDHIPDPYYDGAEGFETVLDLLENGCGNLYDCFTTM